MKKIALLFVVLLSFTVADAQFKQLAEGPVFEEPQEGAAKIFQLKNGNTMFIYIDTKRGIDVRVYSPSHEESAVTHINPAYGKLSNGSVDRIFEINGDIVLMMGEVDSRTPMLYRLIINGKTGELKEEKKIGELNRVGFFQGYALAMGGVPEPDFFIRKDPNSDNYAIVMFNSFESERSKRMEIVVYGPDNKELRRAYYASPEEKYKYLRFVDMVVLGSDKVCVLAYGYNTKNSGGEESELILANLDKGATSVNFTDLNFSKDLTVYWGLLRFNLVTKTLILAAIVKEDTNEKGYTPILAFVNPYEKKIERTDAISPSDRINEFSKKGFTGLPQNIFINENGTFTIVSEEITQYSGSSGSGTLLGDMAIVNYSKTGEFINDYIIRKAHFLGGASVGPFYHARRQGSAQYLSKGNQFKSFDYVNGKSKNYILFNDTERNNDNQEQGSIITVQGVGACDGFYYTITGEDAVPKREYVFGNPESKKDHNLALFTVSDYDRNNNIYATLKLERTGRKKGVKVVWLQP